jgi:hypothetical protein
MTIFEPRASSSFRPGPPIWPPTKRAPMPHNADGMGASAKESPIATLQKGYGARLLRVIPLTTLSIAETRVVAGVSWGRGHWWPGVGSGSVFAGTAHADRTRRSETMTQPSRESRASYNALLDFEEEAVGLARSMTDSSLRNGLHNLTRSDLGALDDLSPYDLRQLAGVAVVLARRKEFGP